MPLLRAKVTSGHGWAAQMRAGDVAKLSAINGEKLIDGSLNLISSSPVWLNARSAIYRNGSQIFWRASLEQMPVVLNRWASCPAHVFEIFASVHLRSALGLRDGNIVHLEIADEIISPSDASLLNRMVWSFLWKYREKQIYRDGIYPSILRNRFVRGYTWRSMQRP